MNNFENIRKYIKEWQFKHDNDFQTIPNDNHSCVIFNHKNEIIKFMFSNKTKRDDCLSLICKELISQYHMYIEQEEGLTFYYFN